MNIAVLTGGASAERDVAIASAAQVVGALRRRGHTVSVVDTAGDLVSDVDETALLSPPVGKAPPLIEHLLERERDMLAARLSSIPAIRHADVLFLALHGGRGEDGTLQAVLDVLGVPYTGSGALGSAVAMDKDLSKKLFQVDGIPTAPWIMAPTTSAAVAERLGWPVVVKPSKQGSTVGLSIVRAPAELAAAVTHAFEFDDEVMVEAFVPGRELTVGILDNQALAVGEIIPRHEIFDYECKYTPGMAVEIFPANLAPAATETCRALALAAHRALKLGGYSRVDFRLTPQGEFSCLEVNTLPGMTATSLLPQSAAAAGIPFEELCEKICLAALARCNVK